MRERRSSRSCGHVRVTLDSRLCGIIQSRCDGMPKGYWIACYRKINDADALARYAKAAVPVIEAGGGRMIARGVAQKSYEAGKTERTVVIEFDSVASAISTYESDAY